MCLQRGNVGWARARRDHHGDGIAGNDAQQHEHDDRHARERQQRHGHAIDDDGKQHHRSLQLTASTAAAPGAAADRVDGIVYAFDTRVGCKAPETFGITLREDL